MKKLKQKLYYQKLRRNERGFIVRDNTLYRVDKHPQLFIEVLRGFPTLKDEIHKGMPVVYVEPSIYDILHKSINSGFELPEQDNHINILAEQGKRKGVIMVLRSIVYKEKDDVDYEEMIAKES